MSNEAVSQILDQMQTPQASPEPTMAGASTDALPPAALKEEEKPAAPLKDDKLSSRLEILIKREQQALARERAAKQKEAEIEQALSRIKEFEGVKTNPKRALDLLGLSYDELTQSMLQDGAVPPEVQIRKLREEWEAERRANEEKEKQRQEEQRLQHEKQSQATVAEFKNEIKSYLKDNSSRYELIAFEGQEDLVYEVIDEHYNRTIDPETGLGKIMSIADAADKVEEHLEKKYQKSKDLSKVKAFWGAIPKEAQEQLAKQVNKSQPPKTLTNQLSATPSAPKRTAPMTDQERIQRAIAYAKGLRP